MILKLTTPPGYTLKKTVRRTNKSLVIDITVNPEIAVEWFAEEPPPLTPWHPPMIWPDNPHDP